MSAVLVEKPRYRFERIGVLAIDPQAFFGVFAAQAPERTNQVCGDVEVLKICGPIDHHDDGQWCDSFEAIERRMQSACEGPCTAIVLKVDSPGGAATGCFETARRLRSMAAAAGKQLYAYVEGQAHSASYALACAASRIVASDTATVGSIGVISSRIDVTAADAREGLRYAIVATGARKSDRHPNVSISDEELHATQVINDSIASVFFDLVAEFRGSSPAAVAALDAGLFHGAAAIAAGLVDAVQPFDALLASIASSKEGQIPMAKYADARAALEEIAKGDDEEAKKAKKAIAAMDEADPPEDDKGKDDKAAESDAAEPDDDDKPADKPDARSGKVSTQLASQLATTVRDQGGRLTKLEQSLVDGERKALLEARPDLGEALLKVLASKPLDEVKQIVDSIPVPKLPKPAAAASVTGTRGAEQGAPAASAEASDMDLRMGLTTQKIGVVRDGNVMRFGVMQVAPGSEPAKPAKEGAK